MKKTIEIPLSLNDERKFKYFPEVSKEIFKTLYGVEKLVEPKDHSFSFFHTAEDGVVELVKSKIRVDMPSSNTFMIDKEYVKALKKQVKKKQELYKAKGVLAFPVIKEKKIYIIEIDKLSKKMLDTTFVKNTYSEEGSFRQGEYYYIDKDLCEVVDIEGIDFVLSKN